MIENRELSMDDYLAMVRRRLKIILIPALLAPLAGRIDPANEERRTFRANFLHHFRILINPGSHECLLFATDC